MLVCEAWSQSRQSVVVKVVVVEVKVVGTSLQISVVGKRRNVVEGFVERGSFV